MAAARRMLIGAVEGGGTKFACVIAESPLAVIDRAVIATRDPASTFSDIIDFFQVATRRHGELAAMAIACFGPLQLRRGAANYGCLLRTPKEGWSGVDLIAPFKSRFGVPVCIDTDVAAAARGELQFGAGRHGSSLAYVTVGTGVGGAVAPEPVGGRLMHAEMGHLIVRRDPRDAEFAGLCPFHGDCLEGLASGPAVRARWGCDLSDLPSTHPGRAIVAGYLAQMVVAIALLHSPEVLVLGGGVMQDAALLSLVREATCSLLRGYLPPLRDLADVERFIRAPALAGGSGIVGAVQMALDSLKAV